MLVPNFNYVDRIWKYIKTKDYWLLEELKSLRELHPRKFMASLHWACEGADFDYIKRATGKKLRGVSK